MEKLLEWLLDVATGQKSRMFWAFLIVVGILGVIVFPYIDANFLYYDRIDKRINNLQKLVDVTGKPLEENTALMEEYQDILVELETAREKAISHATSTEDSQQDKLLKFAGAAALWVFAAIGVLFSKKKDEAITLKKVFSNILGSVFCIAFGWLLGYIFTFIPTLGAVHFGTYYTGRCHLANNRNAQQKEDAKYYRHITKEPSEISDGSWCGRQDSNLHTLRWRNLRVMSP